MKRVFYEINHGARDDKGNPVIRIKGWVVLSGCGRKIVERFIPRYADENTIEVEKDRIAVALTGKMRQPFEEIYA